MDSYGTIADKGGSILKIAFHKNSPPKMKNKKGKLGSCHGKLGSCHIDLQVMWF